MGGSIPRPRTSSAQPHLAVPQGRAAPGAWHRALTRPCCSQVWVWLFFVGGFHRHLSKIAFSLEASFIPSVLQGQRWPHAVGELSRGRGQRYDRAGCLAPGHCAWSSDAAKSPAHVVVSAKKKEFSPPTLVGKGK